MFQSCARTFRPAKTLASRYIQGRWASSLRTSRNRDRFSILTEGQVSKKDVLKSIAHFRNDAAAATAVEGGPPRVANASAILVSRDLSRWLDDTEFMSALIHQLHPSGAAQEQDLSILTAAVDGLCPRAPNGAPSRGLSILQGDADVILPGLWTSDDASDASFMQRADDARPALSMRLNPLLGDSRPVDLTLPLANTVFQNARPFTLLASRWRRRGGGGSPPGSNATLALVDALEKETQRISASVESIQAHANISAPLFPLTPPRQIGSGLGNIIRQVDVDGVAKPASEELEARMHAIIATRSRLLPGVPVPNRTWALIVPEWAAASLDFLESLPLPLDSSIESEHERSETLARHFSKVLADGGRLHRVLSGGGGWGQKRGLLSLDPQTTYSSSEQQDLESFIASFGGESTTNSIVTPGSYVQFLVEPMPLTSSVATAARGKDTDGRLPSLMLGTMPAHLEAEGAEKASDSRPLVEVIDGHFGALSSSGVYVKLDSESSTDATRDAESATTVTKVDAPNSYVWEGPSRWV